MSTTKLIQRLLKNSTLNPLTGCWDWTKSVTKWGYGHINVNGKIKLAHRISYEAIHPLPTHLCVLHKCDNPRCINPEHLFLGTNADNVRDKVSKGRQSKIGQSKGENHSLAKLSNNDVLFIRASSLPQKELAVQFNTTQSNISLIKNRVKWTHI
jgi:HNH endonuclease